LPQLRSKKMLYRTVLALYIAGANAFGGSTGASTPCPCVGTDDWMYQPTDPVRDPYYYPPRIGSYCREWDVEMPYCNVLGETPADWCSNPWCYVDADCALADVAAGSYFPPQAPYDSMTNYYSYSNCGAQDDYTGVGEGVALGTRRRRELATKTGATTAARKTGPTLFRRKLADKKAK